MNREWAGAGDAGRNEGATLRRATLTLVLALVAAACGTGDTVETTTAAPATTTTAVPTTTTQTPTTTGAAPTTTAPDEEPPPGAAAPLVISSVDFDEEFVVITNVSGSDYPLDGHFICNFPSYAPIGDLGTIAAGESFTVELSKVGAGATGGELGIYTTNDFGNSDAMVVYVEWGTAGHGRTGVAVAAGLWTEGDFVDNGHASFRALTTGGSSADYELVE